MHGLKAAGVEIDRKMLADIAVKDAAGIHAARRAGQGFARSKSQSVAEAFLAQNSSWRGRRFCGAAVSAAFSRIQNRRQDAGATGSFHYAMDANPISTGKILPPLDAATPEQVAARFGELRARFDQDAAGATDENGWKSLRDAWLGRKSGLLTQVTDTWLKPSKPELKRAVGQALNELKAHVEAALESRRAAIEAAAEQTALAREREDLSLPGVVGRSVRGIRCGRRSRKSSGFFSRSATRWLPDRRWRRRTTISRRSIFPSTIRRATTWTRFTWPRRRALRLSCCARILRRCRCARWKNSSRPCASLCRESLSPR